jgi:hypothetical protein
LEEEGNPVAFAAYSPREENPEIYTSCINYTACPKLRVKATGKY